MKSFITLFVAAAGLLDVANASPSPHLAELQSRQFSASTKKGCYSSNGGAKLNSTSIFNTDGYCQQQCGHMGKPVMLLGAGKECWCGDLLPSSTTKLDNSKCNFPCPGAAKDNTINCGGLKNIWFVYNDGVLPVDPDEAPPPTSSTTSPPTAAPTPTDGGSGPAQTTIVTTAPASSSTEGEKAKKSGPNVAAIAAGVVVGLVIIAAIAGGVFIYMRRQKRREIEEEHRRNAAVSSLASGKPPMSAGSSFNDTRLDPLVMARRQSDASIADNQDYSRRILKVTNA